MKHLTISFLLLLSSNLTAQNYFYSIEEKEEVEEEVIVEEEIIEEVTTSSTYLFTEEAKNTLKSRFETDYVTASGFTSDFKDIKENLDDFLANPSQYRPIFGGSSVILEKGQIVHKAGLYAYAMDDVEVANVVSTELLQTVNSNSLNTPFWSINHKFSTEYSLFIQTAKVKKLKDTYYLIKNIQNTLTEDNKKTIENWFKDYKDLVANWLIPYTDQYLGTNWEHIGVTTAYPEGLYPEVNAYPYPLQYFNGNNMTKYAVTWFQDIFNNRMLDNVAYLHSWAIYNDDIELENYTREFFKAVIKYGTWSDGTFWELIRNTPDDNTLGVFYTNITLTSMVYMAHLDAQANHYPNDRLYDYKTTDGILNGSTNLTIEPYAGGSTTDGVTQKSIKTLIMGQSNYLKHSTKGGWYDLRYNNGSHMSTIGTRQNSVIAAVANLYYKDQDLKDYYLYNTSVGYPSKVAIYEGWGVVEDNGAWGNLIIGGAWLEQENNFDF